MQPLQRPGEERPPGALHRPLAPGRDAGDPALLAGRRCLIPLASFTEWRGEKGRKIPVQISAPDGEPLAVAGLWEVWQPRDAEPVYSYTMVTCDASPWMRRVHDRMPAVLDAEGQEAWLDAATPVAEALDRLRPYAGELLASE